MLRGSLRVWVVFACLGVCGGVATAGTPEEVTGAKQNFKSANSGVRFLIEGGRITRVYGKAFATGADAVDSADRFVREHSGIFGVDADDLRGEGRWAAGLPIQPVLYLPDRDDYRFLLVYYSQYAGDYPVFRADLRLLVRNEAGYPLVLAASALRNLGDFRLPQAVNPADAQRGFDTVRGQFGDFSFTLLEPVVWAGVDDMQVEPRLAHQFIGQRGRVEDATLERVLFLTDAVTGDVLYREDQVIFEDVSGNVSGQTTQGLGADVCGEELPEPYAHAKVSIDGGSTVFADENGDFIIPNGGNDPVTVRSGVVGQWFNVLNRSGAEEVLTMEVTPPGPANFVHNPDNNDERIRAQTNGYRQSNIIRDFTLAQNPDFPVINNQQSFLVNVNINSNCNAFYDGSSINFYTSGGGCPNTAFSTIVHHEYGHHLVQVAGSGQGQYGEGMGDTMGVLITDDPVTGYGWRLNCSQGLRDARAGVGYPCNGQIHSCGRLISGCVWDTRNELRANYPDTYREILSSLTVNAILLHTGNKITPQITIDFLTLDDDDGDIDNGTPHYDEIDAGFGAHNMGAPERKPLVFQYPDGTPDSLPIEQETTFQVRILDSTEELDESSPAIHVSIDGGTEQTSALTNLGDRLFEATLPAVECGANVTYYLTAETLSGMTIRSPATTEFFAVAGSEVIFTDDFETFKQWVAKHDFVRAGYWRRAEPVGGGNGDPDGDYDGSGMCYVTGNNLAEDLDGGPAKLTSPVLDLSAAGRYVISYARWFTTSNAPNDRFIVEISNNGGSTWTTVEDMGDQGGWGRHSFNVADFVTPTASMHVRFRASDNPDDSRTEAAVDAFRVDRFDCAGDPTCVDVKKFKALCKPDGKIKAKAVLRGMDFSGKTVGISIDGLLFDVVINGRKAKLKDCCYAGGPHTVVLERPADCFGNTITVDCP